MYDICCIGHITSDKVVTPKSLRYMPGGTAFYFSHALSRLDVRYLLVTALGDGEMRYVDGLRKEGIEVKVQHSAHTVFFENIYEADTDNRTQNVLETADAFTMEQLNGVRARIFHLGPLLAGDFTVEIVERLAAKGTLSLDVQGYLRKVESQKVYASEWPDKAAVLPYISILKADVAELQALTGLADVKAGIGQIASFGVKEILITDGSKGSLAYFDGAFYTIPAYSPPVIADATGCGDTYIAGYLFKRIKGAGIKEAAEFAAAMSGLKTAVQGAFDGTEAEVLAFLASTATT